MASKLPSPVTKPYLLLGEGRRDALFFDFLCRNNGITNIQFDKGEGYESYEKLLKPAWSARTGFDALSGLVVVGDNDPNEGKTFRSIHNQLQRANLASPEEPLKIARKIDSPPVVIMMMPFLGGAANQVGALESVLIPVIEKTFPVATKCFASMYDCIGAEKWRSQSSKDKLKVRCILSCSCEENPMAGVESWFLSTKPLIPFDDPTFGPLVYFLGSLAAWFDSGIDRWEDWKTASGG